MNRSTKTLAAALLLGAAPSISAEEWAVVGPRAMGMGGVGVAVTRGGLSSYWNPAALAPPLAPRIPTFWDVEAPASVNALAANDFLREVDDVVDLVNDLDFESLETVLADPATPLTGVEVQKTLRLLTEELPDLGKSGTGVVTNASAGLLARIGPVGFSALGIAHAGGLTRIDLDNLALGTQGIDGAVGPGSDRSGQLSPAGQAFADSLAADGLGTQDQAEEVVFQAEQAGVNVNNGDVQGRLRDILAATAANDGGSPDASFTSNQSGVDLRGILLQEYALSFAQPLFDLVSLGVNVKLMNGWSYFKSFDLHGLEDGPSLTEDLIDKDNREESMRFGVDAGILVQPVSWLSLGVVGRNLNNPSFEFKGPGDYEIERQFRAGVGIAPGAGFTLAADLDLVRNDSEALPGYHSQVVAAGAELAMFDVLFLRGGVSKNLAEGDEDLMIHAGLGLRVWVLQVDAAASIVPDFTEITTGNDGDNPREIPERVGASLLVGVNLPLD